MSELEKDNDDSEKKEYSIRKLKEYFELKKFYIIQQYIIEDIIVFIKVYSEQIGESILIYFPSKYKVPKDTTNTLATIELDPLEINYKEINIEEEEKDDSVYNEIQIDGIKDSNGYNMYKPLDLSNINEMKLKKIIYRYNKQLENFKNCVLNIPYKFSIVNEFLMCNINRHNEIENYIIRNGKGMIKNIIDTKTDNVISIEHELSILIDLPNFYNKLSDIQNDIIKLYKNFYHMLTMAHTKQTATAESKFKNYQAMISKMVSTYNDKNKFLDILSGLNVTLEKNLNQETQILQKIDIIKEKEIDSSMIADRDKNLRLSKQEQDLIKIRDVKKKTMRLLQEVKSQYHNWLLKYDYVISQCVKDLKNIEDNIRLLELRLTN